MNALNFQVDALRKDARNTLELCCKILANTLNCRLLHAVRYAQHPCQGSFGKWETMIKTRRGVLQFHLEQAGGVNDSIACNMLQRINGPDYQHLGFSDPSSSLHAGGMEEDTVDSGRP